MGARLVRSGAATAGERNDMAADIDADKELIVHRKGYEGFIRLFRTGAIVCMIIAFIVILLIS
jgi:hypothetical protein